MLSRCGYYVGIPDEFELNGVKVVAKEQSNKADILLIRNFTILLHLQTNYCYYGYQFCSKRSKGKPEK